MKPPFFSIIVNGYTESENLSSAINLISHYAAMPMELKKCFELIVIDDHSPAAITPPTYSKSLNIRIFRIDEDIKWNQPGARNLGATYARSDNILMHDIGQCAPTMTLFHLLKFRDLEKSIYRFTLSNERGENLEIHPNTLFMSRARFLKYFGYDEEFAGFYGREDSTLVRLQRRMGARIKNMSPKYPMLHRSKDEDFNYSNLVRDMERNTNLMQNKLKLGRAKNMDCFSRKFLSFKFHLVHESSTSD